jgi:hypothetical protein
MLVGVEVLSTQRPDVQYEVTVLPESVHNNSLSYGRVLRLYPENVQCLLTRAPLVLNF